jgi:hypothetical protein
MVFAGNVPGTTTDFFVRRCDLGQDYDATDDRCEYSDGNPTTSSLSEDLSQIIYIWHKPILSLYLVIAICPPVLESYC